MWIHNSLVNETYNMMQLLLFVLFIHTVNILGAEIRIAGFFGTEESEQELAFRFAIERINHDFGGDVILEPVIENIATFDSFNTSRRVCELVKEGIGGIMGPQSPEAAGIVESITSSMDIPLVKTFWDVSTMPPGPAVNVFPDPAVLAKALVAVIEDMDWISYAIIYENDFAIIRFHELLKSHKRSYTPDGHVPFTVWQLDPEGDHRPLLKEIQNSSETHIVLDCSPQNVLNILRQAREVKMLGEYNSYVLTSLDAHTLDFEDLQGISTNITTLRLIDSNRHMVQAAVQDWVFSEQRKGNQLKLSPGTLLTEAALMYDAVYVYAEAVRKAGPEITVQPLSCSEENQWEFGAQISELMRKTEMEGMTGKIAFDKETGKRSFFTIEITELTKHGFRKIGSWDPQNLISHTRSKSQMESEMYESISNKTFIVVSRLGAPYLTKDNNGNLQGYSLDLIDEIAKDLNFKYKFTIAPDNEYGTFNKKTKQWNGLIKELREKRADLAICDLTITFERRSAVDFTMPFMTLGISILFAKPVKQPPDLFSFLLPFSVDVWIYMATAYLGVSILLYLLARVSPYEWKNPHPCNPKPEELENPLAIYNAIWHNIGSLMQQGSDIAPQAISTRIVAGMWWFFVLIMISSYTANLAAFLTSDRMDPTIENVEDLAAQSKIKYGVKKGGSTSNFFRDSNVSLYQKIWNAMESAKPSVFMKDNDDGVDRVLNGKRLYAFFMESTSIEYQVEKRCQLQQVGGTLDSKGYGIALPFNSQYRIAISGSVLKMQQSGKLNELKDKWWKNPQKQCTKKKDESQTSEPLNISNVGGVFLVLIIGCVIGFFVSLLEFLWNVRKVAVQEKISPKEAFLLELKFALRCYGTTKPVRKAKPVPYKGKPAQEAVSYSDAGEDEDEVIRRRGLFGYESDLDSPWDAQYEQYEIEKNTRAMSCT